MKKTSLILALCLAVMAGNAATYNYLCAITELSVDTLASNSKNQFTLPHFESPRDATAGLPAQAENYVDADAVQSVEGAGKFRHSITVHKMECDVLYVKLRTKSPKRGQEDSRWVERNRATDFFASSFCLKALELALS